MLLKLFFKKILVLFIFICFVLPVMGKALTKEENYFLKKYIEKQNKIMTEKEVVKYLHWVNYFSDLYNLNPLSLMAITEIESNFNPKAIGRYKNGKISGAYGLMQVHYPTWKEKFKLVSPEILYNIKINVWIGSWILKYYVILNNNNFALSLYDYFGAESYSYLRKFYKTYIKIKKYLERSRRE